MRTLLVVTLCFLHAKINVECKTLDGYDINKSSGLAYRIVYQSQTWPVARDNCEDEGAQLAVPETQEDFLFIQKMVRGMKYPNVENSEYKLLVWLGVNNLDNYKIWKTVDGKNFKDTKFNIWAEGNGEGYSDDVEEPHCAGMDAMNNGLREYWCHRRQPYVCQLNTSNTAIRGNKNVVS